MSPRDLPEIVTSGSQYKSFLRCPRLRWWEYEVPSGEGRRGWQRKAMSLPLSTGSWCHKVVEGLLRTQEPTVIIDAIAGYSEEVRTKGLDLGLQLDGFAPEERFVERTIREQAALLEAFGWAYLKARLPRLLDEYEVASVEAEEFTLLSGDVGLQSRCDAVLRRRADGRLFIYNLKTSSSVGDKRWKDQWEVDQQLMTETLAVERRLGETVYGVIIDGFDKGQRVEVDWQTLKERPKEGQVKWQAQRSRLIYGYRCEDIPGRPTMYDYEGTTRKGWEKFAVFESEKSVAEWVSWLPLEVVEAQFVTLPPIMRDQEHVEAKVRQMVQNERRIRNWRSDLDQAEGDKFPLDAYFPQNDHSCIYPTRCPMYRLCWEPSAADDPALAGYVPREANHPEMESE